MLTEKRITRDILFIYLFIYFLKQGICPKEESSGFVSGSS